MLPRVQRAIQRANDTIQGHKERIAQLTASDLQRVVSGALGRHEIEPANLELELPARASFDRRFDLAERFEEDSLRILHELP